MIASLVLDHIQIQPDHDNIGSYITQYCSNIFNDEIILCFSAFFRQSIPGKRVGNYFDVCFDALIGPQQQNHLTADCSTVDPPAEQTSIWRFTILPG